MGPEGVVDLSGRALVLRRVETQLRIEFIRNRMYVGEGGGTVNVPVTGA